MALTATLRRTRAARTKAKMLPDAREFQAASRMTQVAIGLPVLVLALPLGACGAQRLIPRAFCAITAYQPYRDVQARRLGWAAFQAVLAAHNCHQARR